MYIYIFIMIRLCIYIYVVSVLVCFTLLKTWLVHADSPAPKGSTAQRLLGPGTRWRFRHGTEPHSWMVDFRENPSRNS